MRKRFKKLNSGFTLVEILLYLGISVMILSAVSTVIILIINSNVKNQTIAEVDQQGIQIVQQINQSIRNSESIAIPQNGVTGSASLVINTSDPLTQPILITIDNGMIFLIENNGSPTEKNYQLTSDRVTASDLTFDNLGPLGGPASIRYEFTLVHINPAGRNAYDYSQTFGSTITLKTT